MFLYGTQTLSCVVVVKASGTFYPLCGLTNARSSSPSTGGSPTSISLSSSILSISLSLTLSLRTVYLCKLSSQDNTMAPSLCKLCELKAQSVKPLALDLCPRFEPNLYLPKYFLSVPYQSPRLVICSLILPLFLRTCHEPMETGKVRIQPPDRNI